MHLYIKLASCLALLTDNPSNRYTGGNPEQGFWRRFADGLNQKFSFTCDAGQSSQELKEKNYLQLYETDVRFSGNTVTGVQQGITRMRARKRYFFIRSVIAENKPSKTRTERGEEKKGPIFGASQLAAATLTARLFRLAGRHFFPFKKLQQRRKLSQSS